MGLFGIVMDLFDVGMVIKDSFSHFSWLFKYIHYSTDISTFHVYLVVFTKYGYGSNE